MVPYFINDEWFATKDAVKDRCRQILARTPDNTMVGDADSDFLYGLFQHHDEWAEKAGEGVKCITTLMTSHGTRCFMLRRHCDTEIDIGFTHAVKLIPSTRAKERQPQKLLDFRAGARTAVTEQIRLFRDQGLVGAASCPVTGESLGRHNVAVDHLAPNTFDQLLFSFCQASQINPLGVVVGSRDGVVAFLEDTSLRVAWEDFHLKHAQLRIISKTGNLKLPKPSIPWMELCSPL
jgi:hypothetical protein